MTTLAHTLTTLFDPPEPTLSAGAATSRARAMLHTDAHAIHAGERLAWAMASELAPALSFSRVHLGPMWLEPWAACAPLRAKGLACLLRTATVLRTKTGLVCIDPCLSDAWHRSPLGERMRSLHPRETTETTTLTLRAAIGPLEPFTEVIFTSLAFQSLRELIGTTHGDGLGEALAPLFPGARIYVGPGGLAPDAHPPEARVRGGLARLRTDLLTVLDRPTLLPSGLVAIPTPGPSAEHLTVAFVLQSERPRVAIATSSITSREQLSPYESGLPGLREHARLRDTDIAPRGDAQDSQAAARTLRFERALADRDPQDPRFHLAHPALELRP